MVRMFNLKKDILIKALLTAFLLGGNYLLNIDLSPYLPHFKVIIQQISKTKLAA